MKLCADSRTCRGNVREVNQDAVLLRLSEKKGDYFVVMAVCDGVGGLEHSEIASSMAVQRLGEWYDEVMTWLDIGTVDIELMAAHLKDVVEACNQMIWDYQMTHSIRMGTTLSLFMLLRDRYYIVQVGDSRIYCYQESVLKQLTVDASVTRIKDGRPKVYLSNYLGRQEELWFTTISGSVWRGDLYLACSDGLYHCLREEDLASLLKETRKERAIGKACEQLIEKMLKRGERDNISAGMISVC